MKTLKIVQIVSSVCIVVGLLGVAPTLYYRYKLANANAVPTIPVNVPVAAVKAAPEAIAGNPVKITLASLGIDVPVVNGAYDQKTQQWNLGLHTAQFATITTTPNNLSG